MCPASPAVADLGAPASTVDGRVGPEKGAPVPVVGCSVCGALTLDWETHIAWHDWHDVHDDFGVDP